MTGSTELGLAPGPLRVHLVTGADFQSILRNQSGDWPVGTTVALAFDNGAASWTATISGTDATFAVDKATADTIPDKTGVRLTYANGTTDQTWKIGTVVRHD